MDTEHAMTEIDLPIGYRFLPTDEELIRFYLINKVFHRPIPAEVIHDIDANELYSKAPKNLLKNIYGESAWYFFVHQDEYFHGTRSNVRTVGNGIGFWRCSEKEYPIYSSDGNLFAFKVYLTYFSGSLAKAKKTQWSMEKYRLNIKCGQCGQEDQEIEEWILGKITQGNYTRDYTSQIGIKDGECIL